jgi:hypothetical protein
LDFDKCAIRTALAEVLNEEVLVDTPYLEVIFSQDLVTLQSNALLLLLLLPVLKLLPLRFVRPNRLDPVLAEYSYRTVFEVWV